MAFAGTMVWEVRTTGSNSNGGGFDPTSGVPGTDFSQQDAAQIAFTDLVIDGTTNTKCTSAANPFGASHVGNIINVTGGTGFTVQRVQIMSVTGVTATVDKSLGTLSSTGGTGNLGGGLADPGLAGGLMVQDNIMWVKSGTYSINLNTTANTAGGPVSLTLNESTTGMLMQGYQTTRGTLTTTQPIFQITSGKASTYCILLSGNHSGVVGITVDGQSLANTGGISLSAAGSRAVYCAAKNCSGTGINQVGTNQTYVFSCVASVCATGFAVPSGVVCSFQRCTALSCTTTGFNVGGDGQGCTDCFAYACQVGFTQGSDNPMLRCFAHSSTSHGFSITNAARASVFQDCGGWGNGGFGIANASRNTIVWGGGWGSNTSGNFQNSPRQIGVLALTADPVNNASGKDFGPNNNAGGGAVLRGAIVPATYPILSTTDFADALCFQHQDAGGTTAPIVSPMIVRGMDPIEY